MARVVRTQSIGTQRTRLSKSIVLSIREIHKKQKFDQEVKELVAYMIIAMIAVDATVEESVAPWEKRGYWVKADRFRMDWSWAKNYPSKLRKELNDNNWDEIIPVLIKIGMKLNKIEVSEKHRMGKPWIGAWDEYILRELNIEE